MGLIEQLKEKVYIGQYNTLTFYKSGIPIVTVKMVESRDVFIITNNMKDLNAHKISFDGNVHEFANKVFNVLIEDEVSIEGVESITFNDGLFIHGRIERDKVIVIIPDIYVNDEGEDVAKDIEHIFYNSNALSELTIAEIVSVFVHQYYL